jgi:molecular chaperone DnaJ
MAAQREWYENDYYKTLGVSEDADAKIVTKAYRKLARALHPDANPGNAAAEERFKEVSAAYDVLGDDSKRKEYDQVRRYGPQGAGGGGPGGFNFNVGNDGFGDLFSGMFGRQRGGPGGVRPQRGDDLATKLTLDFVDAARGKTTTLHLTSEASCSTCSGSGAAPGSSTRLCGVCGGRGVTEDNQGVFSFPSSCSACQGKGSIIETPCGTCRGKGTERRPRDVAVRIPAGISDGVTIRLKDRGGPGRNGGPSGDLLVECQVLPHPFFTREGLNLVVRVPVTYPEAVAGADIRVPTLEGERVTLRLRPGAQPGSKHRVKGKGIVTSKGTGDLIVHIDLAVPADPSPEELVAVEGLREVTTLRPRVHLGEL